MDMRPRASASTTQQSDPLAEANMLAVLHEYLMQMPITRAYTPPVVNLHHLSIFAVPPNEDDNPGSCAQDGRFEDS